MRQPQVYLSPTSILLTPVSPDRPPRPSPFPHVSHITFLVYFLLAALLHGCISGYSEEVIAESGRAERSNRDGCEKLTPAGSCLAGLQAGKVSLIPPGAPVVQWMHKEALGESYSLWLGLSCACRVASGTRTRHNHPDYL